MTAARFDVIAIVYRCPKTGENVQGWLPADISENEGVTYESLQCAGCTRIHFVNRATSQLRDDAP